MNIVSALLERRRQQKAIAEEKHKLLHDRIDRLFPAERSEPESSPVEQIEQEERETVEVSQV